MFNVEINQFYSRETSTTDNMQYYVIITKTGCYLLGGLSIIFLLMT